MAGKSSPPTILPEASQRRWNVSPDALFRMLEEEAVILDMGSQKYFGLNPVGTRIWQLLAEHGTIEPVVATLLEELDVEEERLRQDVEKLVAELSENGLIRPQDPGSADGA